MTEPELRIRLQNGELVLIGPSGQELKIRHTLAMGQLSMNILSAMHAVQVRPYELREYNLGSAASPLQSMVDEWERKGGTRQRLVERGARRKVQVAETFTGTLEDLGL